MQIPKYQDEYPVLGVLSNGRLYIVSILHRVLYLLLNPSAGPLGFLKCTRPQGG